MPAKTALATDKVRTETHQSLAGINQCGGIARLSSEVSISAQCIFIYTLGGLSPPTNSLQKVRRMGSAFRTVVSAAGVMSACYVLMSVNWIQVLLLFLAACLCGCIYMCQSRSEGIIDAPRFRKQIASESDQAKPKEAPVMPPLPQQPNSIPQERVSVYRFPIHKISGNSFAEI